MSSLIWTSPQGRMNCDPEISCTFSLGRQAWSAHAELVQEVIPAWLLLMGMTAGVGMGKCVPPLQSPGSWSQPGAGGWQWLSSAFCCFCHHGTACQQGMELGLGAATSPSECAETGAFMPSRALSECSLGQCNLAGWRENLDMFDLLI